MGDLDWIEGKGVLLLLFFFFGDLVERVTQRGGGCPILEDIRGQAGAGSEQPGMFCSVCENVKMADLTGSCLKLFRVCMQMLFCGF